VFIRAIGVIRAVTFANRVTVIGFHKNRTLAASRIGALIGGEGVIGDGKCLGTPGCDIDGGEGIGPLFHHTASAPGVVIKGETHGNT
jgi:hypothetical protein